MTRWLHGERIGKQAKLAFGCCVVIFDAARQKVLLTRRADNGSWCLPGGHMEPGESVQEACLRECREETGLEVRLVRLLGVYSNPNRIVEYAGGNRQHVVALCFEAIHTGGTLGLSDETTAYGYFSKEEIARMDVFESHLERIADAFDGSAAPYIR